MPKEKVDIEIPSQPEVETNASGKLGVLNWLCHHAGQIAKGSAALLGLAALGGIGYFARGYFSGTKKTDAAVPEVNANATDGRSIVARESAGIATKSEDLTVFSAGVKPSVLHIESIQAADEKIDFGDTAKEIEEVITPSVKRSLMQNGGASGQSSVGATTVNNLVVNGAIPDQLIQVGYPWAGSINMTELFGEQVTLTQFALLGNRPWPDWLQASPEPTGSGVPGFYAYGITVSGNFAYVACDQGLKIIDISNGASPKLIKPGVPGFYAYGITVSGNLVYVTAVCESYKSCLLGGLKIIDIINSTNPVLMGNLLGFTATRIAVNGNLAYVASFDQGLKIINISNSTNPFLVSNVPGFTANDVTVSGNLAYVAASDQGLKIIDISNSSHPFPVGPGVPGFSAQGVTVIGNFAYVACDQGLKIIDISNITSPKLIEPGVPGFYALGVTVSGNLAYVASAKGLKIIDISNSAIPKLIEPGMPGFYAYGITVSGNLAYVAASDQGLKIIDLAQWQLSGSPMQSKCFYQFAISAESSHDNVTKIFYVKTDNFPYVTGSIPNQSLNPGSSLFLKVKITSIFNDQDKADTLFLAINPRPFWLKLGIDPFFMAKKTGFYSNVNGVTVSGNFAYVAADEGLKIIDISNSTNPKLIEPGVSIFGSVAVTISDNLAYVATSLPGLVQGLVIIDVSNSSNPVLTCSMSGFVAQGVIVRGNLAYVASWEGLQIIDISNSTNPVLIGDVPGFLLFGVAVRDNLAYVVDLDRGLKIIDISDSTNPFITGNVSMPGFNAYGVTVSGNFAYVAADEGLKIIDISNSTSPKLIEPGVPGFYARGVTVSGNLAYVAADTQGLKIIDISQPSSPIIVGEVNGVIQAVAVLPANTVCTVGDSFSILDLTNYKFFGTPISADAGNYDITVVATDPDGAKAQTSFLIRVEGGPRLSPNVTIPPQIALVGQSANFFLDQGTFYDPNEDVITYSASLANGGKLPYFLSFNPSSATFSSIPTSWDTGNYMITIFASDRIVYPPTPANFILAVQDPIADQIFIVGRNASSVLAIPPDTTFEGRSLVYGVKPRNSASMPRWLYFNAANRTLFAAPNATDVGTTPMQVTLNDGYGEAFFLFSLNVKFDTPPILGSMISTQTAEADKFFRFTLPGDTFNDADGDTLSYNTNLGGASWLKFDAGSKMFSGTPSGWSDAYPYVARKYTITVTATDPSNKAATGTFELNLNGPSSWEILINAGIAVLGASVTAYGYTHKKYLLWDFFKKEKYMKPIELLTVGATEFSHRISFPADHIKSIIVTLSHDRSCAQNMSPCLRKTLGFFPGVTKDTEERIFLYSGVSAYLFPWLFYDSKTNTLKSVEGGPTEEFVGKDIKIQIRGTDNRIMEEFHIKVKSQLGEAADEEVRAAPSSKAKHKKDTAGLGEPLISPIAANDL